MKLKKVLSVIISLSVVATSCAACNNNQAANNDTEGTTLRYWVDLSPYAAMTVTNMAETQLNKTLEEKTGFKIVYEHPPQGQSKENFNLMLASEDLPDIICTDWNRYPGGAPKAIYDGYIIDHKDVIDKYAPNYKKLLDENPEVAKLLKTDDGAYIGFGFIRLDKSLGTSAGPFVRQDWLDDLGLEKPETIDEWTTMLRAFRDEKGASAPLSFSLAAASWGAFVGAYDTINGFFIDDGQVKYGPIEPGFKDFLSLMHSWYEEKLLDSNVGSLNSSMIDSNLLNGETGASTGSIGQTIGRLIAAAPTPEFDLQPVKYPVLNKGDKPEFGHCGLAFSGTACAITSTSKNQEAAAKFLDFGFSEEGHMVYNFGTEGISYEMIDGYPTYTELITKNPDGLSFTAAMSLYTSSGTGDGAFVQDKRYMEQYSSLPAQKEAQKLWPDTNALEHALPNLSLKPEETSEFSRMQNAIDTYRDEMFYKFILGVEPIDNFDQYVEHIKQLGIDKTIGMYQEALERYNNR